MITAYQVSYQEDQERYNFPTPHLFLEQAEGHLCYLRKVGADDPQIKGVEIDSIPSQKVTIAGDVVGYQFGRTKMGKRTVTRKVYDLRTSDNGNLTGKVNWQGRVVSVALEKWYMNWVAYR